MNYRALQEKHKAETHAFPMMFAFSKEQFTKGVEQLGVSDPSELVAIRGGGYIRKSDKDAFLEMLDRHEQERQAAMEADKKGTGYLYEMFADELANQEYGYTYDLEDTLNALDLTMEQVENLPAMRRALICALKPYKDG